MSRMGRDYLKVGQIMEILRQRGDVYKRQVSCRFVNLGAMLKELVG